VPDGAAIPAFAAPLAPVALTLAEIVASLGGEIRGSPKTRVTRISPLSHATAGDIAFLTNPRYRQYLASTTASAIILSPALADAVPEHVAVVLTPTPYLYYAKVAMLLYPEKRMPPGVHPSATLESTVPASAAIGPGTRIAPNVSLGERVEIHANAVIGEGVVIGADSVIHANAVVYPGCQIGERAIIHSGAVIGADGFGFAPDFAPTGSDRWQKIPQVGRVRIGNDVEIGANTSIDRGALDDTVIEDGVKLDNQIQIGHNCIIEAHTIIAGCAGIAGSTRIGRHSAIGGAGMILGHLDIAPHTEISPGTMVMKSISQEGEKYTALYPLFRHRDWQHNAAQLKRLESLIQRVAALEQRLSNTNQKD